MLRRQHMGALAASLSLGLGTVVVVTGASCTQDFDIFTTQTGGSGVTGATGGGGTGGGMPTTTGTGGSGGCNPNAKEVCNGVDDNCDGTVDEGCDCKDGDTQKCGSDVGECAEGTQMCQNGQWSNTCEGAIGPTNETCDGLDNDCDGTVDNGCAEFTTGDNAAGMDDCYKAVLIVDGVVVEGTNDDTSCSTGVFTTSMAPGEILQLWDDDGNIAFTLTVAPSLVEWRCSPSNQPPAWSSSLSQSALANYQVVMPAVNGTTYTVAVNGCAAYLVRVTR